MIEQLRRFFELFDQTSKIMEADISWQMKYNLIFSSNMSGATQNILKGLGIILEWCDPDTTEEEDVCAYFRSLKEVAEDLRKLL